MLAVIRHVNVNVVLKNEDTVDRWRLLRALISNMRKSITGLEFLCFFEMEVQDLGQGRIFWEAATIKTASNPRQ